MLYSKSETIWITNGAGIRWAQVYLKRARKEDKDMMTTEEMKERKKELMYTSAMIAEKSGLPISTVLKVC